MSTAELLSGSLLSFHRGLGVPWSLLLYDALFQFLFQLVLRAMASWVEA
jgi:hypothetical protein